jgi:hypothetical protein
LANRRRARTSLRVRTRVIAFFDRALLAEQ